MACTTVNVEHIIFDVFLFFLLCFDKMLLLQLIHCETAWILFVFCQMRLPSWNDLEPVICSPIHSGGRRCLVRIAEKIATYWLPKSVSSSLCCLSLWFFKQTSFNISQTRSHTVHLIINNVTLLSPLENSHLLIDKWVFWLEMNELPYESFVVGKKREGCSWRMSIFFMCFICPCQPETSFRKENRKTAGLSQRPQK